MSLSDLASLGSFVSGLAVVVTLVFLLLQMRQANRNQRAMMQQGRTARASQLYLRVMDREFVRVGMRANSCDGTLSAEDTQLFSYYVVAQLSSLEDSFLQHRAGLLDKASVETDEAHLRLLLVNPAFRAMWRFVSTVFSEDYRRYVDAFVARSHALAMSPNHFAQGFNQAAQEELAKATPVSFEGDISADLDRTMKATGA